MAGPALTITICAAAYALLGEGSPAVRPSTASAPPLGIVALMYHRFVSAEEYTRLRGDERVYSISADAFDAQLTELKLRMTRVVSLDDAIQFAKAKRSLSKPAVLITIDDGNESFLTLAAPILKKHGMRATLFITTDPAAFVFDLARPDQRRLSDRQITELDPAVFDIGAHGHTHRPLRELPDDELLEELRTSRQQIERLTGRTIRTMAVPGNWYDERVLRFARRAGFEAVFTSDRGLIDPKADIFRLPRFTVQGYKSLAGFRRLISRSGAYDPSPDSAESLSLPK